MTLDRTRTSRLAAGSFAVLAAALLLAGCNKNAGTPASTTTDGSMMTEDTMSETPDAMMTTPDAMM